MNKEELYEIIFPKKTFNIFRETLKEISFLVDTHIEFYPKDLELLYSSILQRNLKKGRVFDVSNQQKSFDTIIRLEDLEKNILETIVISLKSKVKDDKFVKVYEMAQLDREISKLRHSNFENKELLIVEKIVNLFNDRYKEEDFCYGISNRVFLCFEKDENEVIVTSNIQNTINLKEIKDINLEGKRITFYYNGEFFSYEFRNSTLYQTRNNFEKLISFKYDTFEILTRELQLGKIIDKHTKEEK